LSFGAEKEYGTVGKKEALGFCLFDSKREFKI